MVPTKILDFIEDLGWTSCFSAEDQIHPLLLLLKIYFFPIVFHHTMIYQEFGGNYKVSVSKNPKYPRTYASCEVMKMYEAWIPGVGSKKIFIHGIAGAIVEM